MKCIGYKIRKGTFTTQDGKTLNYEHVRFYCVETFKGDDCAGCYFTNQLVFDIKKNLLPTEPQNYIGCEIRPQFNKGEDKPYEIMVINNGK